MLCVMNKVSSVGDVGQLMQFSLSFDWQNQPFAMDKEA